MLIPSTAIIESHVARKQHGCEHPGCVIEPGQRYVAAVIPPWTPYREDPDDDAAPLGEWITVRFHPEHHPDYDY